MNKPNEFASALPNQDAPAQASRDFAPLARPDGLSRQLLESLDEAYVALRMSAVREGCDALRRALILAQSTQAPPDLPGLDRERLAFLCASALEFGIEPRYARLVIEKAQLQAPSPEWARWPYPIRIFTFGRPSLVVAGQAIRVNGKAQVRPLEILFYLVASGARSVPVSRMEDALWSAEDGHDMRGAFDMALSRLRRMLATPDALVLQGGRLSLDPRASWVDLWAFERLLGAVERTSDPKLRAQALIHVLGRYQGEFLAGIDRPWAALARERVRSKLIRTIREVARALQQAALWPHSVQLLDRARDRFPLEEEIWRALIRSRIAQGEVAQALHLYDRCRELFHDVLGAPPSPETAGLLEGLGFKRGG